MYKHCTTEESVRRQRQLERCLMDLMQTVPFSHITITQICDLAGISRKSFYRYFDSKEGCLYALIDHSIIDGASEYLPGGENPISSRILFERFFSYWKDRKPLLDALQKNSLSLHLVQRIMVYVETEEHNFLQFLGGSENESYEQILFFVSGMMGLVINWHNSGYEKPASQMADILENVLQR